MSEFKREERYIVVKLKDIEFHRQARLREFLGTRAIPTRECVVAEPHHPHYEETWENVQRWAEGRPTIRDERDALAARVAEAENIIEGWIMNPQTTQATWDAIRELGKWFTDEDPRLLAEQERREEGAVLDADVARYEARK